MAHYDGSELIIRKSGLLDSETEDQESSVIFSRYMASELFFVKCKCKIA